MTPSSSSADGETIVTPAVLRAWRLGQNDGTKESRGRALVIGGSAETAGAVLLAAEAALRAGAGKLQIATVESRAAVIAAAVPEALVRPIPETRDGRLGAEAAEAVADLVERASSILVGPGLSGVDEAGALVGGILEQLRDGFAGTLVLDALGLALVTARPDCLHFLEGRAVLTPNLHELAITSRLGEQKVAEDVVAVARSLARSSGAVVSAGGPTSHVVAPDGRAWRDDTGSSGLAVSGSGDVQAGIVAGLAARGTDPAQAAVWGAHVHGHAGDRLAASVGRLGYLAREILPEIPRVLSELEA